MDQPRCCLPALAPRAKGIRACAAAEGTAARGSHHSLFQGQEKTCWQQWLSIPGPPRFPLTASWGLSWSLAGPQMLSLPCYPGEGDVSPSQPPRPLGLLAASSRSPTLWQLEMVQSGAVRVLVAHEQMLKQPLVPSSREALERLSQQTAHELQEIWIPCKSCCHLS